MKLRIGIAGAGAMADYHARRFGEMEDVEVAAVCDHSPERARAFASSLGIGQVFPDAPSMVESGRVDAIAIACVDGAHAAPALAALSRGLPVFCEKPLARSLADAVSMAQAARASGAPAIVNFSKRNGGALSLARDLVSDGRLGGILQARFSYLQSWLVQASWGDWRSTPRWRWRLEDSASTFGAIGDLGSHLFDAALFLLGDSAVETCVAQRFSPAPAEAALLEGRPSFESFTSVLSGGGRPAIRASFRAEGRLDSFGLVLHGERASLVIDLDLSRSSLRLLPPLGQEGEESVESAAPSSSSTYERFIALARGGRDPVEGEDIGFDHGLAVQRLVAASAGLAIAAEGRFDG